MRPEDHTTEAIHHRRRRLAAQRRRITVRLQAMIERPRLAAEIGGAPSLIIRLIRLDLISVAARVDGTLADAAPGVRPHILAALRTWSGRVIDLSGELRALAPEAAPDLDAGYLALTSAATAGEWIRS